MKKVLSHRSDLYESCAWLSVHYKSQCHQSCMHSLSTGNIDIVSHWIESKSIYSWLFVVNELFRKMLINTCRASNITLLNCMWLKVDGKIYLYVIQWRILIIRKLRSGLLNLWPGAFMKKKYSHTLYCWLYAEKYLLLLIG